MTAGRQGVCRPAWVVWISLSIIMWHSAMVVPPSVACKTADAASGLCTHSTAQVAQAYLACMLLSGCLMAPRAHHTLTDVPCWLLACRCRCRHTHAMRHIFRDHEC